MRILSISEDILALVAGIGVFQGILLALIIYLHPKSDKSVNKFLALYLACLSIIMSGPLTLRIIGWRDSFFMAAFPVLAGPLLYFYIRSFKEAITWRKAIPHLILFFIFLLGAFMFTRYLYNKHPGAEDFPEEAFRSPIAYVFFAVRYTQLIIYFILSRRQLHSNQKSIQHLFSETSRIDLNWIKWLLNGYVFIIVVSIIIFFLMTKYSNNFYLLYLLNIAIATPYIYMATYKGILQPTLWQNVPTKEKETLEQQILETEDLEKNYDTTKSQKAGLNDSRINEIITKLRDVLDGKKLYQQPELTLQELAKNLNFPSHQVSLAINEGMKKSFYDLINGYRVDEAKRLLLDPESINFTVLSVGFEAGFNSKTTFNTVFKKFTGLTPTEFRERQRNKSMPA